MTFKSIGLVVAVTLATFAGLNSNSYAFNIDKSVEGFWYESDLNARRGWGFQYLRTGPEVGVFFAAGYIFDDEGNPIWVTGQSEVFDGQSETDIILQLIGGGTFGPEPGDPVVLDENVGNLNIVFKSCNSASFTFSGGEGPNFTQEFSHFRLVIGGSKEDNCVQQAEFTGCPLGIDPGSKPRSCVLRGTYTSDLTLGNHALWQLDGVVYIGHPATVGSDVPDWGPTLTIEAGTRIESTGSRDALVISRGSKIIAEGQPHAPIVFTGHRTTADGAGPGDWGGLVISGAAPLNTCYVALCEEEGEGGTGAYGGINEADDSGILRYVRVQYAGAAIDPVHDHLPGVSLQGVGSGTLIDYLQIHASYDDGLKLFGGTVNAKHLVVTESENDSVDWAYGYRGNMQYILVRQNQAMHRPADHPFSGENFEDDHNISPRTSPTFSNVTLIGRYDTTAIELNEGSAGHFSNMVVLGSQECVDFDDNATFQAGGSPGQPTGELTFNNSVFFCSTDFDESGDDPWSIREFIMGFDGNSSGANPGLSGYFPVAGSITLGGHELDPEIYGEFFEDNDFAGAFRSRDSAWHWNWTEFLD
jgi:hypothetical protein